jgi:hypothetical protein
MSQRINDYGTVIQATTTRTETELKSTPEAIGDSYMRVPTAAIKEFEQVQPTYTLK